MIPLPKFPPRWAPLIDVLDTVFLTARQLGDRWQYSDQTLSNMRGAGRGLPWMVTPTGGVRYRVADVALAEIVGTRGPLTPHRVALELATMNDVSADLAKRIVDRLELVLKATGDNRGG